MFRAVVADEMAAEATAEASAAEVQVVEFRLGDETFALDVRDVDSIVDLDSYTRVPRSPEGVDGVMDLRGEIIAVVDPRVHFGVEEEGADLQEVLILDRPEENQRVGLRVDDVVGVEAVPEPDIDLASELSEFDSEGLRKGIVRGVMKHHETGLVSWIDAGKLLAETREETPLSPADEAETG